MSDTPFNPYDKPAGEGDFSAEGPTKPPRGCLFYGCVTALVLFVLGLILTLVMAYFAYTWTDRTVKQYTSTSRVPLPPVAIPPDERQALETRWTSFKDAVNKGEAAELTLTADEINALIDDQPNYKGMAYVTIKGDKISAQLSVPIDFLPFGMGKGRFFNGSATLTVTLHDGELIVHAKEFQVNGKAPTGDMMTQFSRENLAKDWNKNPKNAELISRFDSIEIKDGTVHLKARPKAEKAAADDTTRDKAPADDADPKTSPKVDPDAPRPKEDNDPRPRADDAPAEKKAA